MGGEGARCRRRQGALTSPTRHSRGSRLHVPRASPARSTSLRRARSRAPGSRVRFFVPAHAMPILTDRVRGPLAANRCRRLYLLPPSRSPASSAPFLAHVVSASGSGQLPSSGPLCGRLLHFQGRGSGLFPSCFKPHPVARREILAELSESQDSAGRNKAPPSTLPTSRPIPVVVSGREMVVLSVPAEVTVILLDIEGTTTPIAFVKVRGGREQGICA